MPFFADLHIHTYYSRATSKSCNLEGLHTTAQTKGIRVVGTGDITHPEWFAEIREKLIKAENGLYQLRPELQTPLNATVPESCRADVSFMLTGEISSIYKRDGQTRKVHSIILLPDLASAEALIKKLDQMGNIRSDGRPILGLDPRHLLEILLTIHPDAMLIPAHIWTPWFSALGSKSGFNAMTNCFGDLIQHIHAIETGLSSSPPMNWCLSQLDPFCLLSFSDLHSPDKMGRNATIFKCTPSFKAMREAIITQAENAFGGTLELFPEEGKYHQDGHRKCGIVMTPEQSLENDNTCPVCGKALVLGVLHRVTELADRPKGSTRPHPAPMTYAIPLKELLAEIRGCGTNTKTVQKDYDAAIAALGPELPLLTQEPLERIQARSQTELLVEAIRRVRAEEVKRNPGFDGEYGDISVFSASELPHEKKRKKNTAKPATRPKKSHLTPPSTKSEDASPAVNDQPGIEYPAVKPNKQLTFHLIEAKRFLSDLNTEQRTAILSDAPTLCLKAAAASGKTRTLIHKIAHLLACNNDGPNDIEVIASSVTNLNSIKQQLLRMVGQVANQIRFYTPETLALTCLRANPKLTGVPRRTTPIPTQQETVIINKSYGPAWPLPIQEAHARLQSYWHQHSGNIEIKACQEILSLFQKNEVIPLRSVITECLKAQHQYPEFFSRYLKKWLFIDDIQTLTPAACKLLKCLQNDDTNLFMTVTPALRQTPAYGHTFTPETDLIAAASKHTKILSLHLNHRNSRHVHRACEHVIAPVHAHSTPPLPKNNGIRIQHYTLPQISEEARFIAEEIKKLQGGTSSLTGDKETSYPPVSASEIAIFVKHASQAIPIIEALEKEGVPYQNLTETTTATNILNALIPFKNRRQNKPAKDTAHDMSRLPLSETERLLLQTHAKQFPGTLNEFIDHIATVPACVSPTKGMGAKHLKIMLITETTGLAFSVVFIPGCVASVYPSPSAQRNTAIFDQDRQSLYLGMSRASQLLYLTDYERSLIDGHYTTLHPAHYLNDIPEEVIRTHRGYPTSDQQKTRQLDFGFFDNKT